MDAFVGGHLFYEIYLLKVYFDLTSAVAFHDLS